MSINLNDEQFAGSRIFNNGVAGLAKDVTISVVKKTDEDHQNAPEYKLVATDSNGGSANSPFYYFSPRDGATEEEVTKSRNGEIARLVSLARAVMGEEYKLPQVESVQEALDVVMELVRDNAGSKKFNVYATYGTAYRPSQYIGLRKYNFIEPATENSTLTPSPSDNLERVTPDAPKEQEAAATSGWS